MNVDHDEDDDAIVKRLKSNLLVTISSAEEQKMMNKEK